MLRSAESEMVNLIRREIIFAELQPMWPRYLNVRDRRTDGRTTCHGNTAFRYSSRRKNQLNRTVIGPPARGVA